MRTSPLVNSIRSFWISERSDDPEFRRLICHDKVAVATVFGALAFTVAGLIVLAVNITVTLTTLEIR